MRKIKTTSATKWLLAGSMASLAAASAHAVTAEDVLVFSKGPVTLRPQLDLSAQYNDNIFFRDTNVETDFISIVSPGMEFDIGRNENYFRADYNWDNFFYADNDQLNADQHRLRMQNHFAINKFSISGRDNVEFLSSVLSGGSTIRNQRVDRSVFRDEYTLRYDLTEKTSVYVEGLHNTTDYDHPTLFDSNTLMGSGGFAWKAFNRISLFGEMYYGQTARGANAAGLKPPWSWNLGGFLGARGEFTEKLSGTVKAGYETREFGDGIGGATTPVVSIGLTHAFTEKSVLRLTYTRQSFVSAEFVRSQFAADVVDLAFTQAIGAEGRLKGTLGAYYNLDTYEGPQPSALGPVDRSDDLYRAYANVTYDLTRWSSVLLGYEFEKFNSSHPAIIDYDVNRVTLTLAIGY
ncbi:MAG TPA: outer membrane beta-barrel protein [Methylomirabilota bacterium]|nr:outer membrane beta-barrel protein [Methylomirabilota bacterium]